MLKEFSFDVGISPDNRLAAAPEEINADRRCMSLSGFTQTHRLTGQLVCCIFKKEDISADSPNELLTSAAALLRDCYGKIDFLIAPVSPYETINSFARVVKAYRSGIHVSAATRGHEELSEHLCLNDIDEFLSVALSSAEEAAKKIAETDHITIGTASGAALSAAKDLMQRENKRHSRFVVIFTD